MRVDPALYGPGTLLSIPVALYHWYLSRPVQLATSAIGLFFLLYKGWELLQFIWIFLRPSKLQIYCHQSTGSWALVTGATDGIGRGFAEELLRRGFNVLLHGRNPEKLERVRGELAQYYPRRSLDIVVADASKYDDGCEAVAEKARNLPGKLTILLNNVGGQNTTPQYCSVADSSAANIDTVINTNARFPTQLTRALLPELRANAPSLILNCGSAGGILGVPYVATYAGTKAFVHIFTRSLKYELAAEGIREVECLGLVIGNVHSAGNKSKIPFTVTSRACAASALDRVGGGAALAWAHWMAAVPFMVITWLPERILQRIAVAEMKKRVEDERKGL